VAAPGRLRPSAILRRWSGNFHFEAAVSLNRRVRYADYFAVQHFACALDDGPMKFAACGSLLVAIMVFLPTAHSAPTIESKAATAFVDDMATRHQGAFVGGCIAWPSSTAVDIPSEVRAVIVFFPLANKGLFIVSDATGAAFNLGNVDLTPSGQWDLAELEGGMDTVRILSDLYDQVTALPFSWAAPKDVAKALSTVPMRSCKLTEE
jgi:hypothetical protein